MKKFSTVSLNGLAVCAGLTVLAGCNSSTAPPPEITPASAESTTGSTPATQPTEEPKRSSTGPAVKPPAGLGNAQGRVLFNGKPAAGIEVSLCQDIGFISGCSGKTFSSKTDKDGNYTIDKVKPGEYSLAVRVFTTNYFIYPTTGIISASKFGIKPDETLDIRAVNLWKTDLKTLSPQGGSTVKEAKPQLKWAAYPGATQYKVTLSSAGSSTVFLEATSPSIAPEKPLLDGEYKWKVEAMNGEGVKIAENSTQSVFKVAGQGASSKIDLVQPQKEALVDGKVKFVWKPNSQAMIHQIYLAKVGESTPILSFVDVEGSEYTVEKPLEKGQYFWSITARRDGEQISSSDLTMFKVK